MSRDSKTMASLATVTKACSVKMAWWAMVALSMKASTSN